MAEGRSRYALVAATLAVTVVFVLGSFLAGFGGALQVAREPANLWLDLIVIGDAFVVVVVGDAAVMVNPENVWDIARGIEQVLLDEELREQLRCRGREHLTRFSWDRSVSEVLSLYTAAKG